MIKQLSWFFKLEWKRYVIGILALSLVGVLNLIPPKVMGAIVDKIATQQLTTTELFLQLVYLVGVAVAIYGLRVLWRMFIIGTSYHLGNMMRERLFTQFTKMSSAFYQKYRTGDLMAHATNDITALVHFAGGGVMSAVDASVTAFVTLVTMFFTISWQMTLIAILPLPFMILATSTISRKNHVVTKAAQESFSQLNNDVQESVSGIKVVKSFGYQEEEIERFSETNTANYRHNLKVMAYNNLMDPVVLVFVGMSYALTLIVGSYFIAQGSVTIGQMVTFMTYLDMLVWPLMAIGFLFNLSQRGRVSYERIMELLNQTSEVNDDQTDSQTITHGDLVFDIEQFAYGQQPTLQSIQLSVLKGQTLGIVGPTGAGKSTLLKLLMREQNVTKGQITLNDVSIERYTLAQLRQLIGYVPQDQWLFNLSVLDNIRFADPNKTLDEAIQVAKICGVYEDIMNMPEQFDTIVGERGVSLSGGQKQRLAMCRALILNPDILILDDSLSAVDAKTEHYILENLKETRQAKTTIITAHRLSAVTHADIIIVLQNGAIVERGTHDELLENKGWYYQTYQTQQLEME